MGPVALAGFARVEVVGSCRGRVAGAGVDPYHRMFFLSGHSSLKA